jgi:hypothetical protein
MHHQGLRWLRQPSSQHQEAKGVYSTRRSNLDEFVDNLDEMLLPDLAKQIEEQSVLDTTSIRAAPGLLGSDHIRPEEPCI